MRVASAAVAAVLVLSSCSLGPREGWTEAIRGASAAAVEAGTAKVSEHLSIQVIESVARSKPDEIAKRLVGVADFASRTARLTSSSSPKVDLRSEDLVFALPRSSAGEGEPGWVMTDLSDEPAGDGIDTEDRRFALGFPLVSPPLAVELLQGVLTGSVEREGREKVLGADTTRYSGRMAPDSALREFDDEDREDGVTRLLETMGADTEVIPVTVWIDDEGRPRRVRYEFEQRQDRANRFLFTQRIDLSAFGARADVEMPDGAMRTNDFRSFVTEFIRERPVF